ncbi:MAG: HAD family phosphatase [Proteobacteria bacterium]|jgi:putative hydrolase of the HAD superfamily|nr:HAD family phosphatase [Pseudomonadota bacterium]
MSKIKCIFFDFDGVVIPDSQVIALNIMCEELINYDIDLHIDYCIETYSGMKGEIILNEINKKFNKNVPIDILKKIRDKCKNTILNNSIIQPNLLSLLEQIEMKYICSSNTINFINDIINNLQLKQFFPQCNIFSAECVSELKPSPEVYLKAIFKANIALNNCIAVEDSAVGILAAKKSGLYSVGYLGGIPHNIRMKQSKILEQAGANKIINCFSELIN